MTLGALLNAAHTPKYTQTGRDGSLKHTEIQFVKFLMWCESSTLFWWHREGNPSKQTPVGAEWTNEGKWSQKKNHITLSTAISKHVLKQHPPLEMFCPLLLKKVAFDRSLSAQHQPSPGATANIRRINKACISFPNYTRLSIGETQLSQKKNSNKFQTSLVSWSRNCILSEGK